MSHPVNTIIKESLADRLRDLSGWLDDRQVNQIARLIDTDIAGAEEEIIGLENSIGLMLDGRDLQNELLDDGKIYDDLT